MRFPERKRFVYARNPLTSVICQVSFPCLLEIGRDLPVQFQKALQGDYPHLERRVAVSVGLREGGNAAASDQPADVQTSHFYEFATVDRVWKITLREEAVSISTDAYTRWEDLRRHVESALTALLASYRIEHFTRYGLRYVNVIDRGKLDLDRTPWSSLVRPTLLGLAADEDAADAVLAMGSVTRLQIADGTAQIRHGLLEQTPPDKQFLLDFDFSTDLQNNADVKNALGCLDKFHTEAGHAFRWSILDQLHERLHPRAA